MLMRFGRLILFILLSVVLIGCTGIQVNEDSGVSSVVGETGSKTVTARVAYGILANAFKLEATLVTWEDFKSRIEIPMKRERYTDKEIDVELKNRRVEFDKYISFDMRIASSQPLYSMKSIQQGSQDAIKESLEIAAAYQKAYQSGGTQQPPSISQISSSGATPVAWNGDTYLLIDEKGERHKLYRIDNPLSPKVSLYPCGGCDNFFYEYRIYFKKEPGMLNPDTKQLKLAIISEATKDSSSHKAYNLDLIWKDAGTTYYSSVQ